MSYQDVDRDEDGEYDYEPGYEYTDPQSDYWEENDHLNVYSQQPTIEDDDNWEEEYERWTEKMNELQQLDLKKGLSVR